VDLKLFEHGIHEIEDERINIGEYLFCVGIDACARKKAPFTADESLVAPQQDIDAQSKRRSIANQCEDALDAALEFSGVETTRSIAFRTSWRKRKRKAPIRA